MAQSKAASVSRAAARVATPKCVGPFPGCPCGGKFPFDPSYAHSIECQNKVVPCPLGCAEELHASMFERHLELCPMRPSCSRCPLGCGEEVQTAQLEMHVATRCPKRLLCCVLGCGLEVPANMMHAHKDECPKRTVQCPNGCGQKVLADDEHHMATCPRQSVPCPSGSPVFPCPLGCGLELEGEHMESHRAGSCGKRRVPCLLGCGNKFEAEVVEEHMAAHCPKRALLCPMGCGAELDADRLHDHTSRSCPRRSTSCIQCGTEMAAYMLEEHVATCTGGGTSSRHAHVASHDNWSEPAQCEVPHTLAMESCVMCGESFDLAALPSHKVECPCRILACPLGCGQEGQSCMLDLHVSKYCPKRGMALATSKGAPPAAAPKGAPTPKQLVTLPLVGPPMNHALPDALADASHLLVAGVKSKPANLHVTPPSTVAAAAGLEPGASAPLELNLSKAAQAPPPKAESAVGPHFALLLIREGIAAQNKDSVRSAMAMAIKAQVPIEPQILTMLQQWLGDEQLPSAHQPAGSPCSSGCSVVTSQSTLCETATPVVARASVQGTCISHTAKAQRVEPDGSDACAQPDNVGTPHPALLMIRDGIASQCKTTVRAALAAATKAQVHIEPQVHTMLMQWLGDDTSQAPGAAPVSAQTMESGVSWQPPAFSASATAPTSVEPAPVPLPVSVPVPAPVLVPVPAQAPVAPAHVPAAAPMFRERPPGWTGLVPTPVSTLDTDGLPPDAAQALAELLAEVGHEPVGAIVPGTVIARPPVITRPPVLVKPEAERSVPAVDTTKTEDAPALAQGIRASRDEEARRPEGQKRRQSPAAEETPAKRANIPETTGSESNGKVPETVPFREREETVMSSAKRKKDVTESKPFKEKDTGLREAWEYMAAGNQWGAGNFFNFDSF